MCPRPGLTLIEVVASLAIIALAASTALTAYTRSLTQWRHTHRLATADAFATELMATWRLEPPSESVSLQGEFENAPGWSYRRTVTSIDERGAWYLTECTLALYQTETDGRRTAVASYTWWEGTREPRK